ncbi:serine hydrolase domain-containing protein [Spirosoma validum]|uniref:Beta-lactamase family protein n=1 Tax=Spirosoma validum TaxID=2771355 RepID=A0A927GBH6_9BACT|nr:serine hydrolase domain-containing protein [Spirosoma validum]MBD2751599.1 beta-lactamase family protein [Spirosoma validum]
MKAWLISALFMFSSEFIYPKRSTATIAILPPEKASTDNPLQKPIDFIVEEAAQQFMTVPQTVGLSVGIFRDGQTHIYNYGEVEKGSQQLPTGQTIYPIASITKTFTGALLAQAVVEKRVNLGDDIRKYLPGAYPNLAYQGQPIRLFHLINHRSGLPFLLPDRPDAFANTTIPSSAIATELLQNYTQQDFYTDLRNVRLDNTPGYTFRYSNTGAQLLGYILERVYKLPFEDLVRQKITELLAMKRTSITLPPSDQTSCAPGYNCDGVQMPSIPDQLQGAAALKSTVTDMLKYVQWNVAEQTEAVKLTHRSTWGDSTRYSAGLNWQILHSSGYRAIWQDGNIPGFSSLCVNYPELNMGIVILSNECDRSTASRITALANQIAKAVDERAVTLPN